MLVENKDFRLRGKIAIINKEGTTLEEIKINDKTIRAADKQEAIGRLRRAIDRMIGVWGDPADLVQRIVEPLSFIRTRESDEED